jgi:two-component system sensor histidine kinase RegB
MHHIPLPILDQPLGSDSMFARQKVQHVGLSVALIACGGVVTYFITRVTRELRMRETELRHAEQQRARSERLEALATLAAGAGHELASPLSTIAVIAKDLARHLEGTNAEPSVLEDLALIRVELDQCRRILDGMASGAGQALGESLQPVKVAAFVDEVMDGIRRREHVSVSLGNDVAGRNLFVPLTGMSHALRGIVRNALDASSFGEPVELTATADADSVAFMVRDRGPGMSPEILQRAGDPFFTTKEPGQGMGLGLFLARNVIERIGGELRLASTPGMGTTVTVRVPQRPIRS